jgi:hypothetical protein
VGVEPRPGMAVGLRTDAVAIVASVAYEVSGSYKSEMRGLKLCWDNRTEDIEGTLDYIYIYIYI